MLLASILKEYMPQYRGLNEEKDTIRYYNCLWRWQTDGWADTKSIPGWIKHGLAAACPTGHASCCTHWLSQVSFNSRELKPFSSFLSLVAPSDNAGPQVTISSTQHSSFLENGTSKDTSANQPLLFSLSPCSVSLSMSFPLTSIFWSCLRLQAVN